MADWDILLAIGIVTLIALVVIAKFTGQTLPELLEGIKDLIMDKKESTTEIVTQVYD